MVDGRPLWLTVTAGHRVRGRVWFDGRPAPGASISITPDRTSLRRATDPLSHATPGTVTDADGRFELSLPPAGSGALIATHTGAARIRWPYDIGVTVAGLTELGDLVLSPLPMVEITVLGGTCLLSAVGPMGQPNMTLLHALPVPGRPVHLLRPPEPGFWWLHAECGAARPRLEPSVIHVPPRETRSSATVRVETTSR